MKKKLILGASYLWGIFAVSDFDLFYSRIGEFSPEMNRKFLLIFLNYL